MINMMRCLTIRYLIALFILFQFSCTNEAANFQIVDLSLNQPSGLGKQLAPTFSWKIISDKANWKQDAFQIIVSESENKINADEGDLWDSGKTLSPDQFHISYKGKPLANGEKYYWKVRVWQNDNGEGKWSKTSGFVSTISYPEDWKAKWITYDYKKEAPLPLLRKSFLLSNDSKAVSARLYISGLGYYEAYFNGSKIGNRVLEPAQTNYEDYAFYSTYDIPVKDLNQKNTLGLMLGNGWYNQNLVWSPAMAYGQPIAIAQLVIKYKDGSSETIGTDESWSWTGGPVTSTNIYAGENYDARLEVPDWCTPSASAEKWSAVKLASAFPPKMAEQTVEPIRKMSVLPVVRILDPAPKTRIYDFGQNFAGWVQLKVKGKKGQKITMRFAEEIDSLNNLDPTSTGVRATKVVQTDQYTCKGEGTEIWEPRFTYHGFRYVEVKGLETKPEKDFLTGIVVYTSMKEAGTFSCADSLINKLHDLAIWTIKSNMHGIPTDCPHRERCGWTGDAHTVATSLIQNLDARLFLTKYLYDMRSSARLEKKELYFGTSFHDRSIVTKPAGIPTMIVPGKRTSGIASPDWGTAAVQLPWLLYEYYGDINILREFYPDMKTWVDYISGKFPEYIVNHGLGDWCPPGGNAKIDCPVSLSSTAFHFLDLSILTKTAQLLTYKTDGMFYADRMNKVREKFNREFFDAGKNSYGSQTADVMALQLGIVPEANRVELVKTLIQDITTRSDGFIQTGIFGLGRIIPALAENGAEEFAFNMLTKKGSRSFENMWKSYGATTLWEVLPVDDVLSRKTQNERSHSHPMNAGYDEWFFRGIAGIHPDERFPGFKKIVFRPYFTMKLRNAEASYESPYGRIVSNWRWEGMSFNWKIQVPANCSADIYLPKLFVSQHISVNGAKVDTDLIENTVFPGFYLYKSVGSGEYAIRIANE